jgi:hypothetical protein
VRSPLIVIAGSADPKRTDVEPPIPDVDGLHAAAKQLGGELAAAECRILVYSSQNKNFTAENAREAQRTQLSRIASVLCESSATFAVKG